MTGAELGAYGVSTRATRFPLLERLWDEGSRLAIQRLGVGPGWRCLEVGAGGGSIAAWLAKEVQPSGSVIATDLETVDLRRLRLPCLRVEAFDVVNERPPPGPYDFIYARLLFSNVGLEPLPRLLKELGPRGVVLLEDYDWRGVSAYPSCPHFEEVIAAYRQLLAQHRIDPHFGANLPRALRTLGLSGVRQKREVRQSGGDGDVGAFFTHTLQAPAAWLISDGLVRANAIAEALAEIRRPDVVLTTPAMVACWGRH